MAVLLGTALTHALHTALEDAEQTINRVDVDRAATVLTLAVTHHPVGCELLAQVDVLAGFFRAHRAPLGNSLAQDRGRDPWPLGCSPP